MSELPKKRSVEKERGEKNLNEKNLRLRSRSP